MRDESNSAGHLAHKPRRLHLLYHELKPSRTEYLYAVETSAFAEHVRLFKQFLDHSQEHALLPAITFDDGHLSDFTQALPILNAEGIPAHFFITVGWTGNKPGYMGWNDLRGIQAAGHQIGAHGWSHALLHHCTPSQLNTELVQARQALEDNLGTAITTMSLPGGRFNQRVLEACRDAGYTTVFTSIPQANEEPLPFTVGRVNIRGDVTVEWLLKLLKPETGLLAGMEKQYRWKAAGKKLLGDRLYERVWAIVNRRASHSDEGEAAGA